MKEQKQKIVSNIMGDCFPACMATLLELPLEVLPNDHSPAWLSIWEAFLSQFGLKLTYQAGANSPIWQSQPWIATVKSLNYKGGTHAVIVQGSQLLFDPSTKKRYKKGQAMWDAVNGGYQLQVADATKLHYLQEYRLKLNPVSK